jgi:hypothetical protein
MNFCTRSKRIEAQLHLLAGLPAKVESHKNASTGDKTIGPLTI